MMTINDTLSYPTDTSTYNKELSIFALATIFKYLNLNVSLSGQNYNLFGISGSRLNNVSI